MTARKRGWHVLAGRSALVALALVVAACSAGSDDATARKGDETSGRASGTTTTSADAASAKSAVALHEAIADGLVDATFTARGGFAGPIVQMTLRRIGHGVARVDLAGQVLRTTGADEQDLGVLGVQDPRSGAAATTIRLNDNDVHDYELSAFCLEPQRPQPSAGRTLEPVGPSPPRLQAVLRAAAELLAEGASDLAVQAAVYRVTNGWTVDDFNDGLTVSRGTTIERTSFGTLTTADVEAARAVLARAAEIDDEFTPLVAVAIDTTVAPFDDPEVVRALGMAVPEGVLERTGYRGIAILPGGPRRIGPTGDASGFWPNWTITDGVDPARSDPREAAKRIADWEARNGPMTITLLAPEIANLFPDSNRALALVQESWEQAGIEVKSVLTMWNPIRAEETEEAVRGRSDNPGVALAAILVAPPTFAELPDD